MRTFLLSLALASPLAADTLPVGHRGLITHAPENTLAAFDACIQLRVGFELDVRRTKDGQLVILHDPTLDRTTDGAGPVAAVTLADLKKLDAGSKFAPHFKDTRVPTLEEVFTLVVKEGKPDTFVAVDLKADDATIETDVIALAVKYRVLDHLLFIGRTIESPETRRKLRAADAKAHVACLAATRDGLAAAIADKDSDWVYARFVPTAADAKQVHDAGKKLFLAGVPFATREPDNWKASRSAGADAILSDLPLEMREEFRGKAKQP